MNRHRKHLDFEVNLIPFIDLLSVCICFLLLTAVWLNVGSMNVKQSVGGQSAEETEKKPVVWLKLDPSGAVDFEVQQSTSAIPAKLKKLRLQGIEGHPDLTLIGKAVQDLQLAEPKLKTALIVPAGQSAYEDIISLMDQVKKMGLIDLGVSPL